MVFGSSSPFPFLLHTKTKTKQNTNLVNGYRPDLCDGSYDQFCTAAPQYHNITAIIEASGNSDLMNDMETYWLPNRGTLENFWEHEWNKHGTCINTLSPDCYGDGYVAGQEVVDFFAKAVELFKVYHHHNPLALLLSWKGNWILMVGPQGLNTYAALESAGIEPSRSKTYTYSEIEDALTSVTGSAVVLGCTKGVLDQAWYTFNVQGNLQSGKFVPAPPSGKGGRGSCPSRGIKYLPK
jgi:ribonuclease T2